MTRRQVLRTIAAAAIAAAAPIAAALPMAAAGKARCGFVPPTPGYAPCTRERGHEGPCAHALAAARDLPCRCCCCCEEPLSVTVTFSGFRVYSPAEAEFAKFEFELLPA